MISIFSTPKRSGRPLSLGVAALLLLASPAPAQTTPEHLGELVAPGVTYFKKQRTSPGRELIAHVLRIDLRETRISIRSLKARGKESLRTMVDRLNSSGEQVMGAINGDFFSQGSKAGIPHGLQVSDGRLIFGPRQRTMIGFGVDNKPYMGTVAFRGTVTLGSSRRVTFNLDGVNVFPDEFQKKDGILLFTPAFLEVEPGNYQSFTIVLEKIEPALQVGDRCVGQVADVSLGEKKLEVPEDGCLITFIGAPARQYFNSIKKGVKVSLTLTLPPIRGGVPQAISGGPRLLRRGRVSVEFDKEDFTRQHAIYLNRKRHPRSAVGYDRQRRNLFLVMVEGRIDASRGVTMGELGELLQEIGCYEGMSFDGGGSAALYVRGKGLVSYQESLGRAPEERAIANSLLVTRAVSEKGEIAGTGAPTPTPPTGTGSPPSSGKTGTPPTPAPTPPVKKDPVEEDDDETGLSEEEKLKKLEKELEEELKKLDDLE